MMLMISKNPTHPPVREGGRSKISKIELEDKFCYKSLKYIELYTNQPKKKFSSANHPFFRRQIDISDRDILGRPPVQDFVYPPVREGGGGRLEKKGVGG